jgi:hypothetical protein
LGVSKEKEGLRTPQMKNNHKDRSMKVLLAHVNTSEEQIVEVPADWSPAQLFRWVRTEYPQWCFLESWEVQA